MEKKVLLSLGSAHNTPTVISLAKGGKVTAVDSAYVYVLTKDGKQIIPLATLEPAPKSLVGHSVNSVVSSGELAITVDDGVKEPAPPSAKADTGNKSGASSAPASHGF